MTGLSPAAAAVLATPVAQLVADAHVGGAAQLRFVARRYTAVADEAGDGHPDVVAILRGMAALALRRAHLIELRLRTPLAAPPARTIGRRS